MPEIETSDNVKKEMEFRVNAIKDSMIKQNEAIEKVANYIAVNDIAKGCERFKEQMMPAYRKIATHAIKAYKESDEYKKYTEKSKFTEWIDAMESDRDYFEEESNKAQKDLDIAVEALLHIEGLTTCEKDKWVEIQATVEQALNRIVS